MATENPGTGVHKWIPAANGAAQGFNMRRPLPALRNVNRGFKVNRDRNAMSE